MKLFPHSFSQVIFMQNIPYSLILFFIPVPKKLSEESLPTKLDLKKEVQVHRGATNR